MASRIIIALLFIPITLLVACTGQGNGTTVTNITPAKPLIDNRIPAAVETATFALG
jgi:hypothetical protein